VAAGYSRQIQEISMRLTYRTLLVSAVLLGAPLAPMTLAQAQTSVTGALPGNDIGTRSSLPRSPNASNITPNDTTSTIAPTPPEPAVGPDANVQALLTAAGQSLAAGQTGTADEALEQAETQILTRSVPQSPADYVSQDPVVNQIEQARTALGSNDRSGALQMINQILASNAPELAD
jgi:hypothetical protein